MDILNIGRSRNFNPFYKIEKGQSLVEMAIITPLLIFMMIGVFEVGWALRGYLILANISRESARTAIRPGYLNFETAVEPGWEKVLTQTLTSASGMLNLNFQDKGTLILTYIEVSTGATDYGPICEKGTPGYRQCLDNYNAQFLVDCPLVYTPTIRIPSTNPTYTVTYGEPRITHFDYQQMGNELAIRNRQNNCTLAVKGGIGRPDGMIISEMWFDQSMLLGFPLISNAFTDPVPMYAHTTMRRILASRGTGQAEPTVEP